MRFRSLATGFTLVEMAVVLVVIGLLISGSIMSVAPILEKSKIAETESRMDKIESALLVYAIQYSCLPCPAADNTTTGTGQFVGLASGCGTSCTANFGAVPWQTLGLSQADIADGFDNRIRYHVTPALVVAGGMDRSGTNYAPLGAITVTQRNNAGVIGNVTTEAAYVLVSHGPNREYGFNIGSAVQMPGDATHVDETENNDADTTYVQGQNIAIQGASYFDDIVVFRTKPILVQMCGNNACGNPS